MICFPVQNIAKLFMILVKVVEDPKQNRDDYFDTVIQYVVDNLDLGMTSKNQEISAHTSWYRVNNGA